jgi:hypothetical protein
MELMRDACATLLERGRRSEAVRLAWQCHVIGDQALAEDLLTSVLAGVTDKDRPATVLAAVEFLWHANQQARAEKLLETLLNDPQCAGQAALWHLAAVLAVSRGSTARALSCLERAVEIQYRELPDIINLQEVRSDYGGLLDLYQQLAEALTALQAEPPREFVAKLIRATDQWRALEDDPTAACLAAARILQRLGAAELAWAYLTTPLGLRPNEAAPWLSIANEMRQQGDFALADRAYAEAFAAEATNAQILWDRAQLLLQSGKTEEARKLFGQIADGQWQPRFQNLQQRAKELSGR